MRAIVMVLVMGAGVAAGERAKRLEISSGSSTWEVLHCLSNWKTCVVNRDDGVALPLWRIWGEVPPDYSIFYTGYFVVVGGNATGFAEAKGYVEKWSFSNGGGVVYDFPASHFKLQYEWKTIFSVTNGTNADSKFLVGNNAVYGYRRVVGTSSSGVPQYVDFEFKSGASGPVDAKVYAYDTSPPPPAVSSAMSGDVWSLSIGASAHGCGKCERCTSPTVCSSNPKLTRMSRTPQKMVWWHTSACSCQMKRTDITFNKLNNPSGQLYGKVDKLIP